MISRFLLLSHLLNINFCCTSYNFLLHSIVIYAFVETLIARTFNHIYNFFKCLFFYSSTLLFRPIKHLCAMVTTLISIGLHNASAARAKSFIAYQTSIKIIISCSHFWFLQQLLFQCFDCGPHHIVHFGVVAFLVINALFTHCFTNACFHTVYRFSNFLFVHHSLISFLAGIPENQKYPFVFEEYPPIQLQCNPTLFPIHTFLL